MGIIITGTVVLFSFFSDGEIKKNEISNQTPADNYPENDREKDCGIGEAKSNKYVKEYKIPTICSQPQAIMIGPDDKVWFVQSNTGEVPNFDPSNETFTKISLFN